LQDWNYRSIEVNVEDFMKEAKIAAPCEVSWDDMTGDDKVRFCDECKLNVFNAAKMTDEEVLQSLERAKAGERVCMQIYRRTDGTFLTKDCPVGLRRIRKRAVAAVSRAAAWVTGALSLLLSTAVNAAPNAKPTTDGKQKPTWHSTIKGDCPPATTNAKTGASAATGAKIAHPYSLRGQIIMLPTDAEIAQQKEDVARCKATQPQSIALADASVRLGNSYELRSKFSDSVPFQLEALQIYEAKHAFSQAASCAWALSMNYDRLGDVKNSAIYKKKYEDYKARSSMMPCGGAVQRLVEAPLPPPGSGSASPATSHVPPPESVPPSKTEK
jgi:hypothetical protein